MLLNFVLTNKEGLFGVVKVGGNLGCSSGGMGWWNSGSFMEELKQLVGLKRWTSGELILTSSKTYLEVFLGLAYWKVRGPKRAGQHLNITSLKLEISASLRV